MTRNDLIEAMARAMFESTPSYADSAGRKRWRWGDWPCDDIEPRKYWFDKARAALDAVEAAGVVMAPAKLLREAHACMRETGWHRASDHQRSDDGVIEAAVAEVERALANLLVQPL